MITRILSPSSPVEHQVSARPSPPAAIDAFAAKFGRIDVVVNNAGIGVQGTVADNADEEQLRDINININVLAIARVTRAALPWRRQSPAAAIVNMSSVVAATGIPQRALYGASKGAVLSLSRAMAADHLREGIRVNCVCPGTSDTPWIERLSRKPRIQRPNVPH